MYGHPLATQIHHHREAQPGTGIARSPAADRATTSRWRVSLLGFALLFGAALFFFLLTFPAFAAATPPACLEGVKDEALIVVCLVCAAGGFVAGLLVGVVSAKDPNHAEDR